MTIQTAFLWLAELLMVFALGCFLQAFRLRKIDLDRHRFWGKAGAYVVFAGLLAVELVTRVLVWEMPRRSDTAFSWHLITASGALVLLVLLLITGLRRIRTIHIRLYLFFLPLFTAAVILSFFAFRLW